MKTTFLDGAGLRGALIMSAEYVQRHRADLNRINVFPVPDGDTGTNLALTVSSIADHLRRSTDSSVGVVAREAANAGIMGARGNCGMILSHFLLGFADAIGDRARLRVSDFGQVLRSATEHVYKALEKPVEGTMITIMRAIADEAERLQHSDFIVLFERLLVKAREALASTPELLPALKARGVVDAGAKGFVHILEGISGYLSGDPLTALDQTPTYDAEPAVFAAAEADFGGEEQFRFCTEALVRGKGLPTQDEARAWLRERGDSLVVIRSGDLLKVHIHTDEPDEVFGYLRGFGELASHKAEDMQAQHAVAERARAGHMTLARRPISVVTDTACDLPDEIVRGHGMHLVPLNLIFENQVLRDRLDMSPEQFVVELKKGAHPSTSQPAPAAFMDGFRRATEEGENVVAVLLSSALSGTYASAQAALKQMGGSADVPVHLFDSKGGSLLQGLLALKASELGELGWEPARILAELERVRAQSGFFIVLDTFERALASGRVGRGKAWLGSLLDIKPVLDIDAAGKLLPIDRVRGRKNALPRMLEILEKKVPRGVKKLRFGVMHVGAPEVLEPVTREIRARYGNVDVVHAPGTPIIGTHAGEGAWGIAYLVED
ncbi:DegV family protein [Longimicrobium sp.]|uniref:DegV family protein n=1 Tax=Longimicrobium sp. TaxID=2029185 RepID=UPI002E303B1F|nr:DegV family protein [Longimicrobium sp.]HEX6039622.1 DegV family protein [Longimicrobium sp.]